MIWVHGETQGGTLGQLCESELAAERFCDLMQASVTNEIRWTLVEVEATESRAAHEEAQKKIATGVALSDTSV
jgi:hypothetical protein